MQPKQTSNKYRSGLEKRIAELLSSKNIPVQYEPYKVVYTLPERQASYLPDFILPNGNILEAKGYFPVDDRSKMLNIIRSRPDLVIKMAFQDANKKIHKTSKTTYGEWCSHHGIPWCFANQIPDHWLKEGDSKSDSKD